MARAMDNALLLAAGKLIGALVELILQTDQTQNLGDLRFDDMTGLADYLERERHVLEHRFVRKQLEVLEDAADIAAQIRHAPVAHVRKILIGDVDMALRGLDLADEHADEGGFAGTGMTDQKHELAGEDLQGDVVEGGLVQAEPGTPWSHGRT